ncbi:MAG TPA: glycosyltransferase [Terriglobales bacterium]
MSIEFLAKPRARQSEHSAALLQRRKVFFLVDSLESGGTERQAVMLATRLPVSKYDVTLGCLRATGPLKEEAEASFLPIVEFYPSRGIDSLGGMRQLLRLAWLLRRGRFDIVHCHDLWSNLMGVPAAHLAGVSVIISSQRDLSHLPWYKTKRRHILRYIQRRSNAILTNAKSIRDQLVSRDQLPSQKVHIVHNGVDLDGFDPSLRSSRVFPVGDKGKRIVLVGNMHSDVKGHPWLIQAAAVVLKEFPDTKFILVGDGARRRGFESQVRAVRLEKSFAFVGRSNDVPSILAECDIAVLPSCAEGLPNAILEYLAAGLPTIATSVGGNTEVINDGVTGVLIPPEDSNALSNALLRLLRDSGLSATLAAAGQNYVRRNFSVQRLVDGIDSLYTELLAEKSAQ